MAIVPADLTLTETPLDDIAPLVARCREAFDQGTTRPVGWRRATLERLRGLVVDRTERIQEALAADLGKPGLEGYLADILTTLNDLDHTLAHLPEWMRAERMPTPPGLQPGSSRLRPEPLGLGLVIAPWNYPVTLSLSPAVAAIAAGNAVVIKPSEMAEASAVVLGELIEALDEPAVSIVQGGVAETTELLAQRFDHILYTGNGRVGRIVMQAAAENLTPVTLELGGKSPAIVTGEADIDVTARRIVWGKFANAGQTCIAPDHVLVERSVHDPLVEAMVAAVSDFYGDDPQQSADYARIVSPPHFHRIEKLLDSGTVAIGGETDLDDRYIAPTILTDVDRDAPVMGEEVFGPVLPVLAVDSIDEATAIIRDGPKPLALYVFTEDDTERDTVIADTSSGGAVVNATLYQFASSDLPFGGVGESGMGAYHGRWGFETFSHFRPVYERSTRIDPAMMYPPFTESKKRFMQRALKIPDPRLLLTRAKQKLLRRA